MIRFSIAAFAALIICSGCVVSTTETAASQEPAQPEVVQASPEVSDVSLEDLQECRNFFKDLSTPAELQALVDRWQVVELLEKDLPYRRIHDLSGVSVTTIGRVARFLSNGFGGYRTAFDRLHPSH